MLRPDCCIPLDLDDLNSNHILADLQRGHKFRFSACVALRRVGKSLAGILCFMKWKPRGIFPRGIFHKELFDRSRAFRDFTLVLRHSDPDSLIYQDLQYDILTLQRAISALANRLLERAMLWKVRLSPIVQLHDAGCHHQLKVFIMGTDIQIIT